MVNEKRTSHFTLQSLYRQGDTIMVGVLWFHLLVAFAIAGIYDTWGVAIAIGLPAALVPTLLKFMMPGSRLTRVSMGVAFMVFSALVIHQAHGMIEMHFGIFVLLAFLLYYRDWLPIITAAAVIAVHHLTFN
ncbi:MAG: methyl-accepting chemotaxis protein, partial [Thiohalophilus sp.]